MLALAADFSNDGKMIAYELAVKGADGERNQIFVTELAE